MAEEKVPGPPHLRYYGGKNGSKEQPEAQPIVREEEKTMRLALSLSKIDEGELSDDDSDRSESKDSQNPILGDGLQSTTNKTYQEQNLNVLSWFNVGDKIQASTPKKESQKTHPVVKSETDAKVKTELNGDQSSVVHQVHNSTTVDSAANIPSTVGVDQLALVLSQALGKISGGGDYSTSNKFLPRQSHGKDFPIFNGRPEEWPVFISNCKTMTTVCGFSDSENLIRLRNCLRGDAAKAVQCLMTSPSNVPEILKILELKYGQPEHIIESLIEKAKALPNSKEDRLNLLIEFGTAVRNLTTTMKTLKCDSHLNNPSLLRELEQKIPITLRTQWMIWVTEDTSRNRNLEFFNSWMIRRTEIACVLNPPKRTKEEKNTGGSDNWKASHRDEKVFLVDEPKKETSEKKPTTKKCLFCNGSEHKLQSCKRFQNESIDSRFKFAKFKRLCFGCLNYGHSMDVCKSKRVCGSSGCGKFHHRLLHLSKPQKENKTTDPQPEVEHITHIEASPATKNFFYSILPVTLKGPKGTITTLAMLDSGSRYTLLDEDVAKQLGLKLNPSPLSFTGFGSKEKTVWSNLVDLETENCKSNMTFLLKSVYTYRDLPLPRQSVTKELVQRYPHLKKVDIEFYENSEPKILIGNDQYNLLLHNRLIKGPKNTPVGVRCKLGWFLAGEDPGVCKKRESIYTLQAIDQSDALHRHIKDHFATEDFGVKIVSEKLRSRDDKKAQDLTDQIMKKVDGKWETGLLWKSENIQLPESRSNGLKRLYTMERKMDKDPEFAAKYVRNFDHYIDSGYIRKLFAEEIRFDSLRKWYLPHFAVTKPSKPKKLRLVFDAAAKSHGKSLNDHLLKGPDLINPLPAVLAKFRQRSIAMAGDIKEMFHQVGISMEDQHSQRLLWRGMDRDREPDEMVMTVMTFGATCSPYCAQEAKNRNAREFEKEFPETVSGILNRHYVDDYLESCDTVEQAFQQFQDVSEVHRRGNFSICNWITNTSELSLKIPPGVRLNSQKTFETSKDSPR